MKRWLAFFLLTSTCFGGRAYRSRELVRVAPPTKREIQEWREWKTSFVEIYRRLGIPRANSTKSGPREWWNEVVENAFPSLWIWAPRDDYRFGLTDGLDEPTAFYTFVVERGLGGLKPFQLNAGWEAKPITSWWISFSPSAHFEGRPIQIERTWLYSTTDGFY